MSLILDALRKLEREKGAHAPGVLVLGSVPWGERSRASRLLLVAGALAVLALAGLAGWLLRPVQPAPAGAVPAPAVPQPLPARPAPTPLPAPPQLAGAPTPAPPAALPPIRLSRPLPPSAPGATRGAPAPTPRAVQAAPAEPAGPSTATAPAAPVLPAPQPEAATEAPVAPEGGVAPAPAPPRPGELRLTAISQRDGRPVALINDRLVFEGDSFDGIRVLRIGETEVELDVRGQKQVLRF